MKRLAILLAFAGASAQAQTPPVTAPAAPDSVEQQIVVIGEKLKSWKGSVAKAEGRLVCRTRTSTGDRKLDSIRCGAMLTCVRPLEGPGLGLELDEKFLQAHPVIEGPAYV